MLDTLIRRASATALRSFGAPPTLVVQAPGRVNLIGEHTDYNEGFVLPCAIDFATVIAAAPRRDRRVRVVAVDYADAVDEFALDQPIAPRPDAAWANYVRGVVSMLAGEGLPFAGADLAIAGNIPQGAGLSSSASLEVAVGQAFKALYALDALDPSRLAQLAQRAENQFVGCHCGIMDQLISARGEAGRALLIDCRALVARPVPIPAGTSVLIAHSRVRRGLVDSHYNLRRQQCETAAAFFGVRALRDVSPGDLEAARDRLDAVVLRRARHVVTENLRVLEAARALEAGALSRLGPLMAQSHVSMRDDFEITVPAIDHLVEILQAVIRGEGGARMTGGGFGGCVVALLPSERVPEARAAVERDYRSPEGEGATLWVCRPSAGTGVCAPPWPGSMA